MKIALLETIEALVSAIKSKFLTKTEAESIYQPKASAINTSNIGSQSVSYASSAYRASNANSADSLTSDYFSTPTGRCLYYKSRYDKDLPAKSAVIHMGAYAHENCTHEVAFCNDGALYTRYMSNGTWQSWTRMAKASEIPDVSSFATEDWVKRHYYDFEEMGNLFYTMDDVDSKLADVDSTFANYLPKSGGTVTGTLNVKTLVVNPRIYESRESDSNLVFQAYMVNNNTKKAHNYSYGADVITFGKGWTEMTPEHLYYQGYIHTTEFLRIKDVYFQFNPSNNTLNISGASGQTVHIAVNGKVIA